MLTVLTPSGMMLTPSTDRGIESSELTDTDMNWLGSATCHTARNQDQQTKNYTENIDNRLSDI